MSAGNSNQATIRATETIVIEREFDAPRELVFEAWTNPQYLVAWYAPRGCTIRFESIDVRPGGRFHSCISNPAFGDCWCVGEYLEIVRPERLVYTMDIANREGQRISAADAGHHPDWPEQNIVSVTFEERRGKTLLTLRQNAPLELARQTGAYPSWLQMLDRLAERLEAT
jgi:uncharacterized protein YndB with AHSA1/START domain